MRIFVFGNGMSTVWEDTDGCEKQYIFALSIYLLTVLSYSYGVIMDHSINAHGNENIVVYGLHATRNRYLNE